LPQPLARGSIVKGKPNFTLSFPQKCHASKYKIMINSYICKKELMKTTVESKKLHLIEKFLQIYDEEIINKIDKIINEERFKALKSELDLPYSEKEFNEMIDRAEIDAVQGKVYTSKDLKKQIQSWK
jgi:hypothetical protein